MLSAVMALTLYDGAAQAGCLNPCTFSVEPAVIIDPPLPCVHIGTFSETCDCSAFVSLPEKNINECPSEIEAVDFSFDTCSDGPPLGTIHSNCDRVPFQGQASINILFAKSDGTGHKERKLHLRSNGVDYTATVTADIKSFDKNSPLGCGAQQAGNGISGLGLAMPVLILFRQIRRRKKC